MSKPHSQWLRVFIVDVTPSWIDAVIEKNGSKICMLLVKKISGKCRDNFIHSMTNGNQVSVCVRKADGEGMYEFLRPGGMNGYLNWRWRAKRNIQKQELLNIIHEEANRNPAKASHAKSVNNLSNVPIDCRRTSSLLGKIAEITPGEKMTAKCPRPNEAKQQKQERRRKIFREKIMASWTEERRLAQSEAMKAYFALKRTEREETGYHDHG